MKKKKKTSIIIIRTAALIICVATMLAIFLFSSQNAESSGSASGGISDKIIELFRPNISGLSPEKQARIRERVDVIVRKGAHFIEFAILGISVSLLLLTFSDKKIFTVAVPIAFSAFYAVTDEVHQLFVAGRAGMLTDVLIDSLGAAVGVLALNAVALIVKKSKNRETDIDKE